MKGFRVICNACGEIQSTLYKSYLELLVWARYYSIRDEISLGGKIVTPSFLVKIEWFLNIKSPRSLT